MMIACEEKRFKLFCELYGVCVKFMNMETMRNIFLWFWFMLVVKMEKRLWVDVY